MVSFIALIWCIFVCFTGFSTPLPNSTLPSNTTRFTTTSNPTSEPSTTPVFPNLTRTFSSSSSLSSSNLPSTETTSFVSEDTTTPSVLPFDNMTTPDLVMTSKDPKSAGTTSKPLEYVIPCPRGSFFELGISGLGPEDNCRGALDCLNNGPLLNSTLRFDVTCKFNKDQSASRCCYRDTSNYCQHGVAVLPQEPCTSLDDCNMRPGQTTERWCDKKSGFCCRHEHKEHRMVCPDNSTALMNEPECSEYVEKKIHSGKCPMENGICYYGHCCPPKHRKDMPGTPYKTNVKCSNTSIIEHKMGYCDPQTGRIWIMSQMNFHGQKNKNLTSMCQNSRDCGQTQGYDHVCVSVHKSTKQCFVNPQTSYYVPEKPNLVLISIASYTALGAALLGLMASILYKYVENDEKFPGETSENLSLIAE